jgi:hypothetical protein
MDEIRTTRRARRIASIAAPLLVVTTSLEETRVVERLFGTVSDLFVLSVFGSPGRSEAVIDLRRTESTPEGRPAVTMIALDRASGERTRTKEIAVLIAEAVGQSQASTVAVGLGLGGGDALEASDAALRARRTARRHPRWIVYLDGDPGTDVKTTVGRIARRRMLLLARGIRLEPVMVAEAPAPSTGRYWEIRAS